MSAAGALAAMATGYRAQAGAAAPASVLNVREAPFNAAGDGVTDDRAAIQAALDAVPPAGGAVFFPPGDYAVSGPLAPRSFSLLFGSHTPLWQAGMNPSSGCKIRMREGFAGGEGLIVPAGDTRGVTLRNLALVGAGIGSNLHGLRMPDLGAGGEQSWTLEDVEIAGFTGDGIFGRLHVVTFVNCSIHDNLGWGASASKGQRWNDCRLFACFFFYNRSGHVYFGGTETSAAVDFVNCRFDRAGTGGPAGPTPVNPSAPGVRLANCRFLTFTGCFTDANNGHGFEIVHEADTPDYRPDFLSFVNCTFNRDGAGASAGGEGFAGVLVRGSGPEEAKAARRIRFVGCTASYGAANDLGVPAPLTPTYGVWYENTVDFWWIGTSDPASVLGVGDAANAYHVGGGNNVRPLIVDMTRGVVTIPTVAPDPALAVPDGALYLDAVANRLNVRSNGAWRSIALS
jgi:hypothetical protein